MIDDPHEAPISNDEPTAGKVEAAFTSAWEMVLNSEERDNEKRNLQSVEEKQVENGPPPEEAKDSIVTKLQEVVTNEVKWQVKNAMKAVTEMEEEDVG